MKQRSSQTENACVCICAGVSPDRCVSIVFKHKSGLLSAVGDVSAHVQSLTLTEVLFRLLRGNEQGEKKKKKA